MTDARTLADEILKAAGSALKHYEPYSQDRIVAVAQRYLDEFAAKPAHPDLTQQGETA